jgi:RHS repeat-associated protein
LILATLALWSSALATEMAWTSTVYVGRHFDVRDRDQPTKYVFNGATRVAAITGSLSTNTRLQRLRLWPSWNLISLAVTAPDLAGQLQNNQPGLVQAVYQWNASTGGYDAINSGQTVSAGSVLWVFAVTNGVCGISGSYVDPSGVQVRPGGEYLASTGLETWTPAFPTNSSAWTHDSQTETWQSELPGPLSLNSDPPLALGPGEALYVNVAVPVDLQIPDPTLRIRYYHQDHLGSTSAMTDANGALVEEGTFFPFGSTRELFNPRQIPASYQYTQKEHDQESGLQCFEARYLAGQLARFLTPDLKVAQPETLQVDQLFSKPQQLNLYAFVLNNPMKYRDPTGFEPEENELKPDTPMHEIEYGAGQLFLETDKSMANHMSKVLAPLQSDKVPTAVKIPYAIVVAPVGIVIAGAYGVGEHVVKSGGHIVKGTARLVYHAGKAVLEPMPDEMLEHLGLKPIPQSVANVDIQDNEPTSMRWSSVAHDDPAPPAKPRSRPSAQPRPRPSPAPEPYPREPKDWNPAARF